MLKNHSSERNCDFVDPVHENSNHISNATPSSSRIHENGSSGISPVLIHENGLNNNHDDDHSRTEMETESSTVEIEVVEDTANDEIFLLNLLQEDLATEDMETTLEDGGGSFSNDDGMISSGPTSNSGSVVSINDTAVANESALNPANGQQRANVDQPEFADFLDMDFDVEPTSTDDDEDCNRPNIRKGNPKDDYCPCHRRDSNDGDTRREGSNFPNDINGIDYADDDHFPGPSTSTVSKCGLNLVSSTMESFRCVSGCRACSERNTLFGQRKLVQASADSVKWYVMGELAASVVSPSSSMSFPASVSPSRPFPRYALNCSQVRPNSINIGGPDGLRLARSAYVGFPTTSRSSYIGGPSSDALYDKDDSKPYNEMTYRIWSIEEAETMQTNQIGPSMCGATALLNVFRALGVEFSWPQSMHKMMQAVPTRLRENDAPVAQYLLSRSVAGTDAEDLVQAASILTDSKVLGRFFPMADNTIRSQEDEERFGRWLLDWLKRGAVPVLTLNMQRGLLPSELMPDAWHHQMVFGVCLKTGGVYLTNPLECVPLWFLKHALCSSSVLLVRTEDIRQRWHGRSADLSGLLVAAKSTETTGQRSIEPTLWTEMNVLGQVARGLRQNNQGDSRNNVEPIMTHVSIPARYRSGVTLYARSDTQIWETICEHPSIQDFLHHRTSDVQERLPSVYHTPSDELVDFLNDQEPSSVVITVGENTDDNPYQHDACTQDQRLCDSDREDASERNTSNDQLESNSCSLI